MHSTVPVFLRDLCYCVQFISGHFTAHGPKTYKIKILLLLADDPNPFQFVYGNLRCSNFAHFSTSIKVMPPCGEGIKEELPKGRNVLALCFAHCGIDSRYGIATDMPTEKLPYYEDFMIKSAP
jgi:hypothetical protein